LAKTLVFENVNEYTLTLQVRNSPDLVAEAQLIIKVKDVNNLVSIVLVVYPYIFLYFNHGSKYVCSSHENSILSIDIYIIL